MPKIRLYIKHPLASGLSPALSLQQQHYLSKVMRRTPGNTIRLFNGVDGEWVARITTTGKHTSLIVEEQLRQQQPEDGPILAFAPTKNDNNSLIVQKATELGASAMVGVYTERTIPHKVNLEKWQAITVEAAEQCQRLCLPVIYEPIKLSELPLWCEQHRVQTMIVADPYSSDGIHDITAGTLAHKGRHLLLIGPEGGFSNTEISLLKQQGCDRINLGPNILRAETAAIAMLVAYNIAAQIW